MNRRDHAHDLIDRLRRAYCKPGETRPGVVFLTEVAAPSGNRRADALALHLTRARPWIDGIEVKVDRSDWLAELDQHTKADAWYRHTHRWWVAAPEPGRVVDPAELPHGWGLMVPDPRSNRRMKVLVKPDVREPDLTYPAVVELLKKIDNERADQVDQQVTDARQQIEQDMQQRERALRDQAASDPAYRREREAAQGVADALDMPLGQLRRRLAHPGTAALVRAALAADPDGGHGDESLRQQLQNAEQRHVATVDALRSALATLTPYRK